MNLQLDWVHYAFPLWYKAWFVLVATYPACVVSLTFPRRFREALLSRQAISLAICSFPAALSLVVAFLGFRNLSVGMSRLGVDHRAAAAGSTEVQFTVLVGLISSLIVSSVLSLRARPASGHSHTIALFLSILWIPFILETLLCVLISMPAAPSPRAFVIASYVGILVASATLISTIFLAFRLRDRSGAQAQRRALFLFSVNLLVLLAISWTSMRAFGRMALILD